MSSETPDLIERATFSETTKGAERANGVDTPKELKLDDTAYGLLKAMIADWRRTAELNRRSDEGADYYGRGVAWGQSTCAEQLEKKIEELRGGTYTFPRRPDDL